MLQKIQEKYIKRIIGLDWRTSGYMLREEVKWDEEKLIHGSGSELARRCLMEIRKGKLERSRWKERRRRFFEERGFAVEEKKFREEKEG